MRTVKDINAEIAEIESELEQAIRALRREANLKISALQKDIKQASQVAAVEARQQIMAILAEHGLSAETVLAGLGANKAKSGNQKQRKSAVRVPPTKHYVGPDGQVWLGRGPHPAWLKGQDKKQFERDGMPQ